MYKTVLVFVVKVTMWCHITQETGDPARVQAVYERALAAFPVTHALWLQCAALSGSDPQVTPQLVQHFFASVSLKLQRWLM